MNVTQTVGHPFLNEKRKKNLKSGMSQRKKEEFPVVFNFKQHKLAKITWINHYMPILQAMLILLIDRGNQTLQKIHNHNFSRFISEKQS